MKIELKEEREQVDSLLDLLPPDKLAAVRTLLEVMVEPVTASLGSVPTEEEHITPATAAAMERARASVARGEGVPHDDILREFGIGK